MLAAGRMIHDGIHAPANRALCSEYRQLSVHSLHVPLPGVRSVHTGIQRETRSSFIIESSRVVDVLLRFE